MVALLSSSPFLVASWRENFLSALLNTILADITASRTGATSDMRGVVCIFPHGRPEKYLLRMLQNDPRVARPLIPPQCSTVSDLFSSLCREVTGNAAWNTGLLDRVGLLLECVRAEAAWNGLPPDARTFFPWGVRLASLFEECFTQEAEPENFMHLEGQAPPFAVMLLERLGNIFARYKQSLAEHGWTTPGHTAAQVAEHLRAHQRESNLPAFRLLKDKRIYIAGFHALSVTENTLFHYLWRSQRATVMLHADPALITPGVSAHWSCRLLQQWAKDWKTTLEPTPSASSAVLPGATPPSPRPAQTVRYYEGFDLHSQLQIVRRELDAPHLLGGSPADAPAPAAGTTDDFAADTAVVLPDSGLLMPALHHLPRADINISMGYPLTRSPLFRLLDSLLRLQENRRDNGYYWRDLIEMVRHPYLKMLTANPASLGMDDEDSATSAFHTAAATAAPSTPDDDTTLRRELHRFEQALRRHARKYPDPCALLPVVFAALEPEEQPRPEVQRLITELFARTLTAFEAVQTPRDMARALEGVCALLMTHGEHLWSRFPIDAECLYRLMQSLIPELAHSALAAEQFPPETLFTLTRRLMDAERVPFEATPLVGLQVMGVLETRLLTFRRVILPDATEDLLPGSSAGDPLLPEALRPALGLPDTHTREQVSAYNFFRLLAGADEVVLLWQEGADSSGGQDRKKKKSRFVEELLWKEEQRQGRLLHTKGTDGPLSVLSATIFPIRKDRGVIPVTPEVRALLDAQLTRPVSATLLDAYLRCPVKFFHERILRLAPTDAVTEEADPLAVGQLLHTVLQEFYTRRIARPLPAGTDMAESEVAELVETFHAHVQRTDFIRTLPADDAAMLLCAGKERLTRFLRHQPPTTVLTLEHTFTVPFHLGLSVQNPHSPNSSSLIDSAFHSPLILTGTADRIDKRDSGIVILDYKTGSLPASQAGIWQDDVLWKNLTEAAAHDGPFLDSHNVLGELAQRLGSVQLPLYLLLLTSFGESISNEKNSVGSLFLPQYSPTSINAAWVSLSSNGDEFPLFAPKISEDNRRIALTHHIPALIHFLLRHMAATPQLFPNPGLHCDWCSSARMCMLGK